MAAQRSGVAESGRQWRARPRLARTLGVVLVLLPIVVGAATALVGSHLVAEPRHGWERLGWWAGLLLASFVASAATEAVCRRLLPLKSLLGLTLVFPDQAPSRLTTARLAGSTRALERRVAAARDAGVVDGPTLGAERVLAAVARLNAHDRRTRGHSERVRAFAELLGEELKVSPDELEKLRWGALLHDMGKLTVDPAILNKRGAPDAREWEILKGHPGAGGPLLEPLQDFLGDWVLAATQHHEKWDGSGYPLGLVGQEISFPGRVVALADAFEVMTAIRSYKKAMPAEAARAELTRCAGSHFDPQMVRAFLNVSLGDLRRTIGPLAWVAEFPLLRGLTEAPNLVTVAAQTLGTALAAIVAVVGLGHAVAHAHPTGRIADPSRNAVRIVDVPAARPPGTTTTLPDPPGATIRPRVPVVVPRASTTTTMPLPTPTTTTMPLPTPTTTIATTTTTTPSPRMPIVASDVAGTAQGGVVSVDVLGNDSGGLGTLDATSLTITAVPVHGTAAVDNVSHVIVYTAGNAYAGADSLTYQVCDVAGGCGSATVAITVQPIPTLVDDAATTQQDAAAIPIGVLANDNGGFGTLDPTSVTVISAPAHGTAVVDAVAHTISYAPNGGYAGTDSFTYGVCDLAAGCATANVAVTVDPHPVVGNDATTTLQDTPVTVDVLANDDGGFGTLDPTTLTIASPPTHGTAAVDAVTHAISYTPNTGYAGTDNFTYTVCDTPDACATANVSVAVASTNSAPIAVTDGFATSKNAAVTVDVLANDFDADMNLSPATLSIVSAPNNGTAVANANHTITYTPANNYSGIDSFTYQVCDTAAACATTSVAGRVMSGTGGAATLMGDVAAVAQGGSVKINVIANDVAEGSHTIVPATVSVAVPPTHGTATANVDGTITYTPATGYSGSDQLTYHACDNSNHCGDAVVAITVVPTVDSGGPLGFGISVVTFKNVAVTSPVLPVVVPGNAPIDPTTISVLSAPANGTATANADGTITYTPAHDYTGSDSYNYQACDTSNACTSGTVTISITKN